MFKTTAIKAKRIKCILLRRTLVNGTLLEKGTVGELVDIERPAAWDGGVLLDHVIYLVRFDNMDPAIGAVKLWLLDEEIFVVDAVIGNRPWEEK